MESSDCKEEIKLNKNAPQIASETSKNIDNPKEPIQINANKIKEESVIMNQNEKGFNQKKESNQQIKEEFEAKKDSIYTSPYSIPKLFESDSSEKDKNGPNIEKALFLSKVQKDARENNANLLKVPLQNSADHGLNEKMFDKTESAFRKGSMDVTGIVSSKAKQKEDIKELEVQKEYTIQFLLAFKNKWYKKPYHMNIIDIPINDKKTRISPYKPLPKADPVKEIRILLNKLAEQNFDKILCELTKDFEYTPELLESLATILFNMTVKEPEYVRLYMRLFDQLFVFFRPKDSEKDNQKSKDLDLRRIIINKVQN